MSLTLIEDKAHAARIELASHGVITETESYITPDGLTVLKSIDMGGKFGPTLHVSCARKNKKPSWKEVQAVKDYFFGEEGEAMILLPPKSNPIGFHPYCIHIWALPESWRG